MLWLSVWPSLPPAAYLRRPGGDLPFPLQEPGTRLYAFGRQGIWQGAKALGLADGDQVLVPAYHHGSEVEALVRAGLQPRYYAGGEDLQPDADELESLVGPRVRALALVHYLGFPQDAARWRAWCDERGLLLIEDAAQAWLADRGGRPVGSYGDLAVFCLYKTLGIPEGAAVLCRAEIADPGAHPGYAAADLLRRNGSWLAPRSPALAALAAPARRREAPYSPGRDFDLGDPGKAPWQSIGPLVARAADAGIAARRRANYRILLDDLGHLVPRPFDALPEGASPFVFPIATRDKARVVQELTGKGLRVLDFWSVAHPSLPAAAFPDAARRRNTTVGLPVHQELRPQDLDAIVDAAGGTGRRRSAQLRFSVVRELETARPAWTEVAARSGNLFGTWEWSSTWWRHFGSGHAPYVTVCHDAQGRAVAVVPVCRSSAGPLRVLRFVGHGPADQLGPICAPADRAKAARALRWTLERAGIEWDVFLAEHLPVQDGWASVLAPAMRRQDSSPVLDVDGSGWESFLAGRSRNFREQVRRRERKLGAGLRYRLADDPARLDADFDTLVGLHEARWAQDETPSSAFAGALRDFHRDFAHSALERGWLRLWIMEIDSTPVAAWYGFRFGGHEWYYQSGRDPAWTSANVGFVLLSHTIREAMADGVSQYKLLLGPEPYKDRFSSRDPGLETLAVSRGIRGRAALAGALSARALPSPARAALRGALSRS